MTDNNKIKVIGAGSPIVDILAYVDDDFLRKNISGEKGGMELISEDELKQILSLITISKKACGGSAGNTIFAMCRLGAQGSLAGKTGDDDNSLFYRDSLAKTGGNTENLKLIKESPTAVSICMVTPDAARTMRTHLGAAMQFSPEDTTIDTFTGYPLLHTEGYLIFNKELITHILKTARDAGCIISLDLSSFEVVNASKDFLPELLKEYVDIIFANEDEAKAFCGTDNLDTCLEILSQHCKISALKTGENGSMIRSGDSVFKINPVKCECVTDTTGAGDYWAAGFLYGYLKGLTLEKCGKLGSFMGAEAVSVLGAELEEDQWEKIIDYSSKL
ncbi:MAG: adenosine kinase [Desulfobacteraceae bacterium]|nr:adenosine kinase [Desulfobacteraceae bacterium]